MNFTYSIALTRAEDLLQVPIARAKISLIWQNKAESGLVGSLGFEPRIANAPGWYTEPL